MHPRAARTVLIKTQAENDGSSHFARQRLTTSTGENGSKGSVCEGSGPQIALKNGNEQQTTSRPWKM
jgi:hypothetical protein